jgi:hypothetical protein
MGDDVDVEKAFAPRVAAGKKKDSKIKKDSPSSVSESKRFF